MRTAGLRVYSHCVVIHFAAHSPSKFWPKGVASASKGLALAIKHHFLHSLCWLRASRQIERTGKREIFFLKSDPVHTALPLMGAWAKIGVSLSVSLVELFSAVSSCSGLQSPSAGARQYQEIPHTPLRPCLGKSCRPARAFFRVQNR